MTEVTQGENQNTINRGRKRPKNMSEWKRVKNKKRRSSGLSYTTRTGKAMPAKVFVAKDCKCARKCCEKIQDDERKKIHASFYALSDHMQQNVYIRGLIQSGVVKQRRARNSSRNPTGKSLKYFLTKENNISIQVCKKFFIETLQISDSRLYKCCRHSEVHAVTDGRGRNAPPNKVDKTDVEEHIRSFPSYTSHYTRTQNPDRRYLNSELTIRKMYQLYKKKCEDEHKTPVKEKMYYNVFSTRFNLHFKEPLKDTCQLCDSLHQQIKHGSTPEIQTQAKIEKELHLRRAEQARNALKHDKSVANDTNYVFTFDLQKALAFPKLTCSVAYYKTNLYVYNLGCHSFNNNVGYMYLWDETQGSRGSQEIASCVIKHIKLHAGSHLRIIMYTDCCTGQNRNIKMSLSLLKLIQDPSIQAESIDHKFLVSGHSFLPNDADFGVIECKGRKQQHIYSPDDWEDIIKNAKTKCPFQVVRMDRTEFLSTKDLEKNITNRKISTDGVPVSWLKIKWLHFRKGDDKTIYYKENLLEDTPFFKIDIKKCAKTGRPLQLNTIEQKILYEKPRPVTLRKKKDMTDLLKFIPPNHHRFYKNLPYEKNVNNDEETEDYEIE